jgi:hypothetical protein
MPTPFESATLNLKLYELRREPVLRDARQWFLAEFNPESFAELTAIVRGPRNATFRMVLGYWDMAASLATSGAIDAEAFRAARRGRRRGYHGASSSVGDRRGKNSRNRRLCAWVNE